MLVFWNQLAVIFVVKGNSLAFLLLAYASNIRRVKNTAEINEVMIPMIKVLAKPLMGPVPTRTTQYR